MNNSALSLFLALSVVVAVPVLACGPEENKTHVGTVSGVDASAGTMTLLDAQTGKLLTFQVRGNLPNGLAQNSRVVIRYVLEDGALVAEQIKL